MTFIFTIPSTPVAFIFGIENTVIGGTSSGDIEIYLDGVLIDTQATLDYSTETVNVAWL